MNLSLFWNTSANFSHLFFWYLSNLIAPRDIVFMCCMTPLKNLFWLWNLLLFGFLTGYGLLIFRYFKKSLESFALVLFLTAFIYAFIASQVRFKNEGIWEFEPNWIYFSSIGFYLFVVLNLLKLREYIKKWLFICVFFTIFVSYFICTLGINRISRTEISYSQNWLRKFPGILYL